MLLTVISFLVSVSILSVRKAPSLLTTSMFSNGVSPTRAASLCWFGAPRTGRGAVCVWGVCCSPPGMSCEGGGYMREIGTMWQIGVLKGKPCTFLVQNGSFSAFWHYKNKERLSRGLDVKWHIPSTSLEASIK